MNADRGNQTVVPPVVTTNPNMLRMIAVQIDSAIVQARDIPDYLKEAGQNFSAAMRRFVEQLEKKEEEKKNGNAAESAGK